jgi:hypothetical protein
MQSQPESSRARAPWWRSAFVRKAHKWTSFVVGAVFLAWVVSGLVMILPPPEGARPPAAAPSALHEVTVSPARAIEVALGAASAELESVSLRSLGSRWVFAVKPRGKPARFVDGASGERVEIDAALARSLAAEAGVVAETASELKSHDLEYPFGPLPTWRVVDPLDSSRMVYVSRADGQVGVSTRTTRLRAAITSLHAFQPLDALFGRGAGHVGLWILGLASLFTIATGYLLTLPKRA